MKHSSVLRDEASRSRGAGALSPPAFAVLAKLGAANLLIRLTAVIAFALILMRALQGLDQDWDTLAYHLPFAARVAGLCDTACYTMVGWLEARFDGFPMFATWLQSLIWRMAGKPDWNDLVNVAGLAVFVAAARICLRAPVALLGLALLTVPLIQIHLSVTYIDLFANAMIATAFVLLTHAFLDKHVPPSRIILALLPIAAATNTKFQMLPVAAVISLAATVLLAARLRGRTAREIAAVGVGYLALALLVLASCIANLIAHGNPVYPVTVGVFGMSLPGVEVPVNTALSLSSVWEHTPRPLVWLASLFEVEAYAGRPMTWDVGQGHVGRDAPSFRMGGYFGIYVLANLILFIHLVRNTVRPVAVASIGVLVVATLLTAFLPANHELRYYMYWMMIIILMNVVLATRIELARAPAIQNAHRQIYSWTVLIAFTAVTAISGGMFLRTPAGVSSKDQVAGYGIAERVAASFVDHGLHCIGREREPTQFFYADIFHPDRDYRVREIDRGDPTADCDVVIP